MQIGVVVDHRFEILRAVAAGGMGTVYRAVDRTTGRPVAIKVLREHEAAERFEREAQLLLELRHPAIVRYIAHGTLASGEPYLAMEWLDGEDLESRLARGRITDAEALHIIARVADALALAHRRSVVHRDLKPANLFLVDDSTEPVRLVDFGIARVIDRPRQKGTPQGMLIGTPGFMSPEQARGETDIDARTDVFALGCVLYECLAGRPAFDGEHVMAVLAKILFEDPVPLGEVRPDLPRDVLGLVGRMLEKSRDARPRDATAISAELAAVVGSSAIAAPPTAARPLAPMQDELHVVSVVLARDRASFDDNDVGEASTAGVDSSLARLARVRVQALRAGARFEVLADGSCIIVLSGLGDATERVAIAARLALALAIALDDGTVVLATGRALVRDGAASGEVIDRASSMLDHDLVHREHRDLHGYPVRLDGLSADLLDSRFFVRADDAGRWLITERDAFDGARTLLGRATPFVGREVLLERVVDAIVASRNASRSAVLALVGPPGSGKSRLRHEALTALAERGEAFELWFARADLGDRTSPFQLVAQAIRRLAAIAPDEPVHEQRERLAERVRRSLASNEAARVTEFLSVILGIASRSDESAQMRAARRDTRVMRDQLQRAFHDFVRAETARSPVVFVAEDVHTADEASSALLIDALRVARDRPFLLLVTRRSDVASTRWSRADITEIAVEPLDRDASGALVRDVLGEAIDAHVVDRIVERASGNAFLLEELIRMGASGDTEGVPATVVAMAQSRLETIPASLRRVLRAASVVGSHFGADEVAAVLDVDRKDGELQSNLATLRSHEWLVEVAWPGRREPVFAFSHAVVHEAAYESLVGSDREAAHLRLAEWFAARETATSARIAEHFERAAAPDRAVPWHASAALESLEAGDLSSAASHATAVTQSSANDEIRGRGFAVSTAVHRLRGEARIAVEHADRALALLVKGSSSWHEVLAQAVMLNGQIERRTRVRELIDELLAVPTHGEIDSRRASALALAVAPMINAGQREIAHALVRRLEHEAASVESRDAYVGAWLARARMVSARHAGDVGAALEWSTVALERFDAVGDRLRALHARGDLAYAYMQLGAYDLAEPVLREVFSEDEAIASGPIAAMSLHNLGWSIARQGRIDEGGAIEREAIERFRAAGDRRMEGASRVYMAAIELAAGNLEQAEAEVRMSLDRLDGSPAILPVALGLFAEALLAKGDCDDALTFAMRALESFESHGDIEEGEARIRLAHIEALVACGREAEASTAAERAVARIAERAARVTSPAWRTSYLDRVDEHVRIRALHERLSTNAT